MPTKDEIEMQAVEIMEANGADVLDVFSAICVLALHGNKLADDFFWSVIRDRRDNQRSTMTEEEQKYMGLDHSE